MTFRRRGRPGWTFQAKTRTGWQQLGTGTGNKALADRITAMWRTLADDERAWDVLDRVLRHEITVGRLYDLWYETRRSLPELRRRLADTDLEPLVADFLAVHRASGVSPATAAHVAVHLRALIPDGKPLLASSVTTDWLTTQLAVYGAGAATRRTVHSSWSSFFRYCTDIRHVFVTNPIDTVKPPALVHSPIRFYELEDIDRLIGAAPSAEMGALWSFMYATGCEVSIALGLTRGDIGDDWQVRLRGTKTRTRDRVALIAEWARPAIAAYLRDKLPAVLLWPRWNRFFPARAHHATATALGLPDIPLRNSRHHWAARQARAGTPVAVIQSQLGHSSPMLTLNLYGRFLPQAEDRSRWERKATKRDARRAQK